MKSIEYIPEDGKDKGRVYTVTRMDAITGDRWARHIIRGLARAGHRTPSTEKLLDMGIAGIAGMTVAVISNMTYGDQERAFEGLLKCITVKGALGEANRELKPYDLNDVHTLPKLREEAFRLNVDFLAAAISQIPRLYSILVEALGFKDPENA